MNNPVGTVQIVCKKCGKKCGYGELNRFCSACGTVLGVTKEEIEGISELNMSSFPKIYTYFYNSSVIPDKIQNYFTKYIERIYIQIEAETVTVINSALRSGYSARLAEEKIAGKSNQDNFGNIYELIKKAQQYIKDNDEDLLFSETNIPIELSVAIYIASDDKFEKYFIAKDETKKYLNALIHDNLNYSIPELAKIYGGKTLLHSLNGLPRYFEKPVLFDDKLKKNWEQNINSDVILGYCMKIAEEIIEAKSKKDI